MRARGISHSTLIAGPSDSTEGRQQVSVRRTVRVKVSEYRSEGWQQVATGVSPDGRLTLGLDSVTGSAFQPAWGGKVTEPDMYSCGYGGCSRGQRHLRCRRGRVDRVLGSGVGLELAQRGEGMLVGLPCGVGVSVSVRVGIRVSSEGGGGQAVVG